MANAAVDNDVLLKGAAYGFLFELLGAIPNGPHEHGILGTARFVLPRALEKRPPVRIAEARIDLANALAQLEALEPTAAEAAMAADLEYEASRQSLPLHAGECQLVAMLLLRDLKHVLTGDRNAISSLGSMAYPSTINAAQLDSKFICFEQAVRYLVEATDAQLVRTKVCAERGIDTSMRVCFSCASQEVTEPSWMDALEAHVADLRARSGNLLAP